MLNRRLEVFWGSMDYSCERGFEHFLKQHQKSIFSYGLHLLNDTYIIENIVQDVFIKLWNFRDTITSHEHAERFLRQSVKWACYSYLRNAGSRFHRDMIRLDSFNNYEDFLGAGQVQTVLSNHDEDLEERRLKDAREALAKVCYGREKGVMELYFIKGLTHTQIAERYHLSVHTITMILDKGKLKLKAILVTPKAQSPVCEQGVMSGFLQTINCLSPQQNAIYQLRLTGRYNFEQIASFLQLPVADIQQEYIRAWKIAGGLKKKTGKPANQLNRDVPLHARLLSA